MERLLVTHIDQLLGSNLALQLADRFEVLGLYDGCPLENPALRTARWNPDEPAALATHFDEWQPHWVVHCGPLAAASWDPPADAHTAAREPRVVAHLANLVRQFGCRLSVISSDAVFVGPRLFHDESSPADNPAPRAAAARAVEEALENTEALIVRTHAYGWSPHGEPRGFAERAAEALTRQATWDALSIDGRRHATPILATDLAELLCRAYQTHLHGLYHLSGAERTSPHRFVTELAALLGVSQEMLPPPPDAQAENDETSLSSKRARRMMAVAMPLLRDGLARFVEQAQSPWRSQWQRAESEPALAEAHVMAA